MAVFIEFFPISSIGKAAPTPVCVLLFFDCHHTTLGFGEVRPATLADEIIVSSEDILGYTTPGLLLSVLAQSIARRS
jgi:hypothetical protein